MENLPVRRARHNAVVAGVCAGLARRWNVDPNLLRIAVVVLALISGLGAIAYGVGVALVPRDGDAEAPVRRVLPFTRTWPTPALVASVIGAGVGLFAILGGFSGGMVFPVIAIAGLWLLISRKRRAAAGVRTAEPTPFERAAGAWQTRLIEHQQQPGALPVPITPPTPQPVVPSGYGVGPAAASDVVPVRRKRGPARLWWLALGLMAAGSTAVALSEDPGPGMKAGALAYLAVVVLSLGITLLVATRRGRPPLMGTLAVLAMLATVGLMVTTPAIGRFGPPVSESLVIAESGDLPVGVTGVAGDLNYDLTGLELTEDRTIPIDLGAGDLTITVPRSVRTEITWAIKAGEANVLGSAQSGLDLTGTRQTGVGGASSPLLKIDITMGAGSLTVRS